MLLYARTLAFDGDLPLQQGAIQRSAPGIALSHLGLTLGALSFLGPLSIDLYLPAFPHIVRDLSATPSDVQRTLSAFLLALATAQIPIGSYSDRHGRKPALYLGLVLFVVASVACAVSTTIESFIVLRFVQGCGICAGTAVSRAMIRDLRSGPDAARLMAFTFLVIGISPVLAPLLGSYLLNVVSWRGIFMTLAATGVAGLLLVRYGLAESLPIEQRRPREVPLWRAYGALARNGRFLAGASIAGLATTIPYAYVTAAPFVFPAQFQLDGHTYALLLGVDSICSIGMAQFSPALMRRWGARKLITRLSAVGMVACTALGLWISSRGLQLIPFQLFSMLVFALVGLILTPAAVGALDAGTGGAGATAAMLGTMTLAITASASAVISLYAAFSALPLVVVIGASFTLAFFIAGPMQFARVFGGNRR
jgi:DHA1 family bicyclomycin/chloramphenicol resistance-like MFS transporter